MPNLRLIARSVSYALVLASAASTATSALGQDEFLDKINKRPSEIQANRRSDKILLGPISKMTPPPAEVRADLEAGPAWILIDPSVTARWTKMKAWAEAAAQKDVLKALAEATKGDQSGQTMAWGIPYGVSSEAADAVQVDLHVDLGSEEPTIAEANPKYLPRLVWVEQLAHVEATRLIAEGKPSDAISLLLNVFSLGRELTDRELSIEVREGFRMMVTALARVRDVAYQDFRGDKKIDAASLRALIQRLGDDQLRIDRIRFPMGDLYGIEQLTARAYGSGGQPDGAKLGPMLARIATREHPLKIFNESARWAEAASAMGDRRASEETLERVYGDWTARWPIDTFDSRMLATYEYDRFSKAKFPLVSMLPNMTEFFDLRQVLQTEVVGTRAALGLLGYFYDERAFAPRITSARPKWMTTKEADPFNPTERDRGGVPPLKYTRPVTDDDRKQPHQMTVVTGTGYNFRLNLDETVWMLWSVGSNNTNDFARYVQNTPKRVTGADYLIWPPMESLTRQHLKDIGELK